MNQREDETFTPRFEDYQRNRSSSPPSSDFFEFLYDPQEAYNMSHAEDIILHGKLLPKDYNFQRSSSIDLSDKSRSLDATDKEKKNKRRRGSQVDVFASDNVHHHLPKLSSKSREGSKNSSKPWRFMVFGGLVKASPPPEIDIRDMKERQTRLSSTTFLPEKVAGDGNIPAIKRRSLYLLEVLSCKSRRSSVGLTEPSSIIVRRRHTSAVR